MSTLRLALLARSQPPPCVAYRVKRKGPRVGDPWPLLSSSPATGSAPARGVPRSIRSRTLRAGPAAAGPESTAFATSASYRAQYRQTYDEGQDDWDRARDEAEPRDSR